MTIKDFAKKTGRCEADIKSWIEKGWIPGARGDYIPNSARIPYTLRRAKKVPAIIRSILKACSENKGISAALYGVSEEAFQAIIASMIKDGLIVGYIEDEVTYYNITYKGDQYRKVFKPSDWIALAAAFAAWFPVLMQMLQ